MKITGILNYNTTDPKIVEMNAFISPDYVCEYCFTVILDRKTGEIRDGSISFAPTRAAPLVSIPEAPSDVKAAFEAYRPAMVEQLGLERRADQSAA